MMRMSPACDERPPDAAWIAFASALATRLFATPAFGGLLPPTPPPAAPTFPRPPRPGPPPPAASGTAMLFGVVNVVKPPFAFGITVVLPRPPKPPLYPVNRFDSTGASCTALA